MYKTHFEGTGGATAPCFSGTAVPHPGTQAGSTWHTLTIIHASDGSLKMLFVKENPQVT